MSAIRVIVLTVLFLAAAPLTAVARCEGAVQLGGLHDAYRATLFESGRKRRLAAMSLLFFVGQQDGATLARHVKRTGVTASSERLGEILAHAETLAKQVLEDESGDDSDFNHGLNVRYLSELFLATKCEKSRATASRGTVGSSWGTTGGRAVSADDGPKLPIKESLIAPMLLVAGLCTLFGGYKLYMSAAMRRRRVERLPRSPVSLPLTATFTSPDGEMQQTEVEAIDISAGGMKVSWPDAPPQGTTVSIQLLQSERLCQVAWSNTYYAGIMFDQSLNKQELRTLKETASER